MWAPRACAAPGHSYSPTCAPATASMRWWSLSRNAADWRARERAHRWHVLYPTLHCDRAPVDSGCGLWSFDGLSTRPLPTLPRMRGRVGRGLSDHHMKSLSIGVGLFGIIALAVALTGEDATTAVLGAAAIVCAFTTFNATAISSFLKIFVGIFSTETIVFGVAVLAGKVELWPTDYVGYLPPVSLPLAVAIFSILVYLV